MDELKKKFVSSRDFASDPAKPEVPKLSPAVVALVRAAREGLEGLRRHIREADGIHPNPEYQIVDDLADALAPFKHIEEE